MSRTIGAINVELTRLLAQRDGETAALVSLRARVDGDNPPTDAEVDTAISARAATDRRIDLAQAERDAIRTGERDATIRAAAVLPGAYGGYSGHVLAGGTPEQYSRATSLGVDGRTPASWLRDIYRAQVHGDIGARVRLEHHAERVEADPAYGRLSERAVGSGGFAGLVPPAYLTDLAALAARNGRPLANSMNREFVLPDRGMSVIVPRGTGGASAAVQAAENTAASSTDETWTNLTLPVATIAGQQDVSRQSIDRGAPGLDQLLFLDLLGAYYSAEDAQLINGTGASGQVLGALNTAGIGQSTAYTAAVTPTSFYSKINGGVAAIGGSGAIVGPADFLALHPRRLAWLNSQVDTTGRPLVVPTAQNAYNSIGSVLAPGDSLGIDNGPAGAHVLGQIAGLNAVSSANIPTAVGAASEDVAIEFNSRHALLLEENGGVPNQVRFDQPLAGNLTVKLVAWGYIAVTWGRYPTATYIVGGNSGAGFGQTAPSF